MTTRGGLQAGRFDDGRRGVECRDRWSVSNGASAKECGQLRLDIARCAPRSCDRSSELLKWLLAFFVAQTAALARSWRYSVIVDNGSRLRSALPSSFSSLVTARAQDTSTPIDPASLTRVRSIKPRSIQVETGVQWESRPSDRVWFTDAVPHRLAGSLEARDRGNTSGLAEADGSREYASRRLQAAPRSVAPRLRGDRPHFPAWGSGDFRASRVTGDVRLAVDFELPKALSLNPNVGVASYETEDGRLLHRAWLR